MKVQLILCYTGENVIEQSGNDIRMKYTYRNAVYTVKSITVLIDTIAKQICYLGIYE